MNLKDKILAVEKKLFKVNVPEIDEPVFVKVMSGAEYEAYREQATALKGDVGMRPLIVAMTACNDKGALLFQDPSELDAVNSGVLERLCHIALKMNGLTKASYEAYEKNC